MILYLDNTDVDGRELDRRELRAPHRGRDARHERKPRARDSRAAHARRRRRLHASTTSIGVREGADGLVDRRPELGRGGGLPGSAQRFERPGKPASSFFAPCHARARRQDRAGTPPCSTARKAKACWRCAPRCIRRPRAICDQARRAISSHEPLAELVERLAKAYLRNDGGLPSVYRAPRRSAGDSGEERVFQVKTLHDFVPPAYRRRRRRRPDDLQLITAFLTQAGQRPHKCPASPADTPTLRRTGTAETR